jgi:hypothetical protein
MIFFLKKNIKIKYLVISIIFFSLKKREENRERKERIVSVMAIIFE